MGGGEGGGGVPGVPGHHPEYRPWSNDIQEEKKGAIKTDHVRLQWLTLSGKPVTMYLTNINGQGGTSTGLMLSEQWIDPRWPPYDDKGMTEDL